MNRHGIEEPRTLFERFPDPSIQSAYPFCHSILANDASKLCTIPFIKHYKDFSSDKQHEYILVQVEKHPLRPGDPVFQCTLRVERSPKQDPIKSSVMDIDAYDIVHCYKTNDESQARAGKPELLSSLIFHPDKTMSLRHFCILLSIITVNYPLYTVLENQCYWFSYVVMEVASQASKTERFIAPSFTRAGKHHLFTIVNKASTKVIECVRNIKLEFDAKCKSDGKSQLAVQSGLEEATRQASEAVRRADNEAKRADDEAKRVAELVQERDNEAKRADHEAKRAAALVRERDKETKRADEMRAKMAVLEAKLREHGDYL